MFGFFKKYTVEDLTSLKNKLQTDRSSHKVALIDDNVFPIVDELRRHGFDITTFTDIEHVDAIKNYGVIISDIKGVGKKFGSKFEGAHLIEEIHKQFPNKYLIAYSSSTFNPSYNEYFKLCDITKRKGIDIQEWVRTLDISIQSLNDPIFQWEKTRKYLIEQKLPINYVSQLEQAYSKSILKKNERYFTKEANIAKSFTESTLTKLAVDSISSFTASFILGLIKS